MRDLAPIPTLIDQTRHDAALDNTCTSADITAMDNTVDQLGTDGGQWFVHPHPGCVPLDPMGTSGDNGWTTAAVLTWDNSTLSTIHRPYYPHYRFEKNKTVSTTGGAEPVAVVPTRPKPRSTIIEKNREYQR